MKTLTINATELRTLVVDNRFEGKRLDKNQLCKEDYSTLTGLYRNALDALTSWASADYAHISTDQDENLAFTAVKEILALYTTDDSRIIIDGASMRTLRDCATQPKRFYSKEYTLAKKEEKKAQKIYDDNWDKLKDLGCTMPVGGQPIDAWKKQAIEEGKYMLDNSINMVDLFLASMVNLATCQKTVENIKAKGHWTWRRPNPVNDNVFADLVENYIGDCLEDGYNIKTSKQVRDEKAEARKQALEAKKANA